MDSLSQLVLGAACAAACVPATRRRAGLLAGAALGTLPDLDILPLSLLNLDAVEFMTGHRAASHSLFLLPVFGWLLWLLLKRRWSPVREAPVRWLAAIQFPLITHPLLDAFTIYGTQLWWPLQPRPVMGGSMFIIDPLYTFPLVIACMLVVIAPAGRAAKHALVAGLVGSTGYLGWSAVAQTWVDRIAGRELVSVGLENAPRFVTPSPLNTLLWRVVVMTPTGYLEGYHSLIADKKPIQFQAFQSDAAAFASVAEAPAVRRLVWFNHGFMKAEMHDGRLVLSDLRMGAEPDYVFRFAVADANGQGGWSLLDSVESVEWPASAGRVEGVWTRLWNEP